MNHLELFSGTHSFGKVSSKLGFNVISLDRDLGDTNQGYKSNHHIKEDILTWDYKQYPKGHFKLITASPVCLWWSICRFFWIGKKLKSHGDKIITREILQKDIEDFGIPMVDKVFEIIDYFNPEYYIIENPQTGSMKDYISPNLPFYDVDYCQYGLPYKKPTRFWTNIEGFKTKRCNHKKHKIVMRGATGKKDENGKHIKGASRLLERYKIPEKLIEEILSNI